RDLGRDAAEDLAMPDAGTDLAVDAAMPDLFIPLADLAGVDLTSPVPDFPSHVGYHYLLDSKIDWTIKNDTTIDTAAMTITPAAQSGIAFVVDGDLAVLAVHDLTVGNKNSAKTKLAIVGNRPLVIVSGGTILVHGLIDAGGHGKTPGAGGSGPDQGMGM